MIRSIMVAVAALAVAGTAAAQVNVRGYTRSDGTYVAPYTRSAPNSSTYDNYGSSRSTPSYSTPAPLYGARPSTGCTGYSCVGTPSTANGQPRSILVPGYVRRNGTYAAPYYRSNPN